MTGTEDRAEAPSRTELGPPFRVLFLCTHNSARSQIGEALLRRRGGRRFVAASAGSHPGGAVHPLARKLIERIGGDPSAHRPKGFDEVLSEEWDLVIAVCDQAAEACPALPARTVSVHWGISDPSEVRGSDEQRMAAFMDAYTALAKRIDLLIALGPGKLERMALQDRLARIHREASGR